MSSERERGQAIVIMVFAIIGVAALVGLAIDGGRVYSDRRQAQNTADASAMAGIRMLAQLMVDCEARSVANDNLVGEAIADFAVRNGIAVTSPTSRVRATYVDLNDGVLGPVGEGQGIPAGTTGIRVTVTTTDTTTFLRVVGQNDYNVGATTTAVADHVFRETNRMPGGGVLPLAVWQGIIENLPDEDGNADFTAWDSNTDYCRDEPCDFAGDHVPASLHGYLNMNWIYNNEFYGEDNDRALAKNVSNSGCAFNDDGTVNVPGTGLKGYASPDCPYPYDIYSGTEGGNDGDWIHGDPGVRAATLQAMQGYPVGTLVWMPVFDRAEDPDYMQATFGHGSSYWPTGGGGTNAANFHIIGFVQAEIVEVKATGNPKYVAVDFVQKVIVSGQASSGLTMEAVEGGAGLGANGCVPNGLVAISLKH